jgi:anti-sigma regulatory factor (Ser/Thr protein kinase)
MSSVRLRIPAKAEYVFFSRLVLTGLSRATVIEEETLSDLKVAVTEACARSVRSAPDEGGDVSVRYDLDGDVLTVEVASAGSEFSPELLELEPHPLDEDGMGIALVRALVDDLELGAAPDGRGSRLAFSKKLSRRSD